MLDSYSDLAKPTVLGELIMSTKPEVIKFDDLKKEGHPIMFINSTTPGHHRMNYALIGDTASENPEYSPMITSPHKFQLGMAMCPPGQGPAYHTHDYIECFFVLKGTFRFWYGMEPEEEPTEYVDIGEWDTISLPAGLWRSFENISEEAGWFFAVLEPHEVFEGKDPYWPERIMKEAASRGFVSSEKGKMVRPDNIKELEQEMAEKLEPWVTRSTGG